ncbi:hypothetical protein H8N00_08605 [Streptomyces sp. AC563]|nr:hypothetical protein [Streptomyces buecherae]
MHRRGTLRPRLPDAARAPALQRRPRPLPRHPGHRGDGPSGGEFIGHQFFGLPAEQHAVFARLHLRVAHLAAWRVRPEQADLTVRVRARPTEVVRGVPRGVELRSEPSLDDVECATGTASLAFLPPDPPLRYAPPPRPAVPSPEEREDGDAYGAPQRPAAAAEVAWQPGQRGGERAGRGRAVRPLRDPTPGQHLPPGVRRRGRGPPVGHAAP